MDEDLVTIHNGEPSVSEPQLPRNVKAIKLLLRSGRYDMCSLIIEMFDANLITTNDIYEGIMNGGDGTKINVEILDLLIAENKMDSNLCNNILQGLSYYPSIKIQSEDMEIIDRIHPFINNDDPTHIFSLPLIIVEKVFAIESLEFNENQMKSLISNVSQMDPLLLDKIIQLLMEKKLDDFDQLNQLAVCIIRINIVNGFLAHHDQFDEQTILHLDDFMDSIKHRADYDIICMKMLSILQYTFGQENRKNQMAKTILNIIDDNNLLDTEESYDFVSFYARDVCSHSSDRMKKYYDHMGSYINLFLVYEHLLNVHMVLADRSSACDTEYMIGLGIMEILGSYIDSNSFGASESTSRTSHKISAKEFIKKLSTNISNASKEELSKTVVNLLDLMESDAEFNEWIKSEAYVRTKK